MTFPSSISDIVASTIEFRSKAFADNVTAQNAVLNAMNKRGNVAPASGGSVINENIAYAENGNGGSYSGYDQLPTGAQDVVSAAQFQWAQYAVPVVFNGREVAMNSGPQQMLDLVKARVKVAESTMMNMLNRHLYLDGTGNNGKNLTGLAAAVPLASTNVYGGIDRSVSTNAFWKNQKFQATVDGAGVATSATVQQYFTSLYLVCSRGTDKPNIIVSAPNLYAIFQASLQAIQRVSDTETANAGFTNIMFMGTPVVQETLASGISTSQAYFLNTDYLHLRPHGDRNMVTLADKNSFNQDATVKTMTWMGNLTCSGAKFQGVFSNT